MKTWKRLLALFLSGAMALSLFACKPGGADEPEDPSAQASGGADASAAPELEADLSQTALEFSAGVSPGDVMLTINGEEVHADLFCYLLGQACGQMHQYLSMFGMGLSDMPDMAAGLLEQGVDLALYHTLIRQKAVELGCLLTDDQAAEVKQAVDEAKLGTGAPLWDLTDEGIRFVFEMNYYYENLYNAVTHDPTLEELEDGYLYRVKHILVKTVDDSNQPLPDGEIAEKRAQAEDLLAQLQAAEDLPAKFDELMNEFSEDGRTEDGALAAPDGYLAAPGDMVTEFEEASQALSEGGLSGLVESPYGYHIILRLPTALTEEERTQHADDYRQYTLENQMTQWISESQLTRSDALSDLNPVDFYNRLAVWQKAFMDENAPAESAPAG